MRVSLGGRPADVSRRALLIGLVVAVIATIGAVTSIGLATKATAPSTPASADCRNPPLAHVHDPGRFTVLSECVVVSGTLTSARLEAAFLDTKAQVALDGKFRRFLRPQNRGRLTVDVVPTDAQTVTLPAPGSHATFYGAWVLNKGTKAIELHPTWRVVASSGSRALVTGTSESNQAALHAGQKLSLSVSAPRSVSVGSTVVVEVSATWLAKGNLEPASEVRVFIELTDRTSAGVRWKALRTNTLGRAAAKLVTLQVPGTYEVVAYPVTPGAAGPVRARLEVKWR